MKKVAYYQITGTSGILTEREFKRIGKPTKAKKIILTREDLNPFYGMLPELSTKDLRKAKVRKDLMRLGIEW